MTIEDQNPTGVIVATTTPFDTSGRLDPDAVQQNTEKWVSLGSEALMPCGSIGEHSSMNLDEWKTVVRMTVGAAGQIPVIPMVGSVDLRVLQEQCHIAGDMGISVVSAFPPYYFNLSDQEKYQYFSAIADVGIRFLIYSNPTTGGGTISCDLIRKLSVHETFLGIKEATKSPYEYREKALLMESLRKSIYPADENTLLFTAFTSATGILTATSTIAPDFVRHFWTAKVSGDFERARDLFDAIMDFRQLINDENAAGRVGYITVAKAALEMRGFTCGDPRPPLARFPKDRHEELAQSLDRLLAAT